MRSASRCRLTTTKGWTKGIERAGYATGGGYAASLQRIIEANGLDKYDSEVMAEMRAEGRSFGVENNPRREMPAAHVPQSAGYSLSCGARGVSLHHLAFRQSPGSDGCHQAADAQGH